MKTIVLFRSKSGFTRKYAIMLAEKLQCDCFDLVDISREALHRYDRIIYGGGLYISGINGIKLFKKHLLHLKDKQIILFATGATPGRNAEIEDVVQKNLTVEQQQRIPFFYLRGGYDFSKLSWIDKILMILLKLKLRLKRNLTPDERGLLNAYEKPVDFVREENLDPLMKALLEMGSSV